MDLRFTLQDNSSAAAGDVICDMVTGYDGIELMLERSDKWHGFIDYMDNSLTDLRFYGNAYTVLLAAYAADGVDADVNLLIEMQCADGDTYEQVYLGKVNFTTLENICKTAECYVSVACGSTGCVTDLKNRMDTKVDLESLTAFDGAVMTAYTGLGVDTTMPGVPVQRLTRWSIANGTSWQVLDNVFRLYYQTAQIYMAFDWNEATLNECLITNPSANNFQYQNFGGNNSILLRQEYDGIWEYAEEKATFDCYGSVTINIELDGEFTIASVDGFTYNAGVVLVYGNDTDGYTSVTLQSITGCTGCTSDTETISVSDSETFIMRPGDRVYLTLNISELRYSTGGGGDSIGNPALITVTMNTSTIEMIDNSLCNSSDAKSYMVNETLSRTAEAITDGCLKVYSDYYGRTDSEPWNVNDVNLGSPYNVNGCGSMRAFTNGLLIRGAVLQDDTIPTMKMSFEELMTGLQAIDNVGWGIESDPYGGSLVRVEQWQYFYDDTVILTCTYAPDVTEKVIQGGMYSQAKVGYQKYETESTNGLQDVFGNRTYRTALAAIKNTYERLCSFIASDKAMEITRRLYGSNTNDFKYDNDAFIICVEKIYGNYEAERFNFDQYGWGTDNVLFPTYMYNVRITPTNNLLRHLNLLNEQPSAEYTFTDGNGNFTARFTTSGDSCFNLAEWTEDQTIGSTVLDDAFALCIRETISVEFEYPLSNDDWQTLQANPYGTIAYSCADGVLKYGYIKSISYNPMIGMATFNLIKKV